MFGLYYRPRAQKTDARTTCAAIRAGPHVLAAKLYRDDHGKTAADANQQCSFFNAGGLPFVLPLYAYRRAQRRRRQNAPCNPWEPKTCLSRLLFPIP
jgi:hypothetical protein